MKKRNSMLAVLMALALAVSAVPAGTVSAAGTESVKTQTTAAAEKETEETEKKEKMTVTELKKPEFKDNKFACGTKIKDMKLPSTLKAKGYKTDGGDKKAEDIKIKGVTWKTEYEETSKAGEYKFTAKLPKNYELAKDVSLPVLKIEITDDSKEEEKESETKAAESEKKTPESETQAAESEKKTPESETKASETDKKETKAAETEGTKIPAEDGKKAVQTKTGEPESEVKKAEDETKKPGNEGKEQEGETKEPESETKEPESETQKAELKIISFELADAKVTIDEEKQTITILMKKETDLAKLSPKVTVPEGITVEPKNDTEVDFSDSAKNPVVYKLTRTEDGEVREYKATAEICGHDWTEATCTTAAVCKKCGAEGEKALGHSFSEATCTAPKTCTRCHITEGSALGHKWSKATCAKKSTCERCKATQGDYAKHTWRDWKVTRKATHTEKGKKERICKVCGEEQTKTIPKTNLIGEAKNNKITGLSSTYSTGTNITFKAEGDQMSNSKPITGDVRYKPVSWNCGNGSGTFDGDSNSKTIQFTTAGDYTLKVTFERQVYKDGKWVKKGDSDTKTVSLKITGKTVTGTNGKVAAATGDNSPIMILAIVLILSAVVFAGMMVLNAKRRKSRK